jgi:hypothetical protein
MKKLRFHAANGIAIRLFWALRESGLLLYKEQLSQVLLHDLEAETDRLEHAFSQHPSQNPAKAGAILEEFVRGTNNGGFSP